MFKTLAYVGLFVAAVATATAVGCGGSSNNGTPDFTVVGDGFNGGGDGGDMNVIDKMYVAATPHDVDTNTIGGNLSKGTAVKMSGLIVLAPPYGFSAKITVAKDACKYEIYAQDPSCSTPPCGIVLETPAIINPMGTGMFCPYAKDTSTALKTIWRGDKVDVQGVVDTFSSSAMSPATGTVVQHSITIDSLTQVSKMNTLPTPIVVADTATSMFKPYSGAGWAMYEGTYIELKPPTGMTTFTTTLAVVPTASVTCAGQIGSPFKSNGSFTTTQGASFADTFNTFFVPKDGGVINCYPPNGSVFHGIQAIVGTVFGGSLLPADSADFIP